MPQTVLTLVHFFIIGSNKNILTKCQHFSFNRKLFFTKATNDQASEPIGRHVINTAARKHFRDQTAVR